MKLSRLILILLALVGGWLAYQSFFAPEGGPEFETEDLKRGEVTARVTATGTLEALTTVTVGSQVSGPVLKVQVDFNSPVEKGQILAELDPSEFQARVSQAQASLDAATAALTNQVASLANADAGVAQAEAQLEAARGQLEQTRAQVGQAEAGVESAEAGVLDLVARSEVDQRRTAYRVGEAGYQSALASRHEARSTLSQAGSRVSSSQSEVKAAQTRLQATRAQRRAAQAQVGSARAQVRQAEANLRTALVDLDRATIRSPITGTVIDRKIDVGQTVQASFQSPDLFKIARDLRHMQVQVEVSEADIGSLKEGQKVTFKVDAHPDKTFEGRVTQVRVGPVDEAEQQDKSVVVYGVLVSAPNPDLLLRPGMTANVT
ncbi:HlyD family efflux transporter periplasmic adaptor subunit, partial [bacterium CPR1]|nr:HlyD family efflux transporter periplasmic adaptor subunit [bacterium CPR1]